MEKICKFEALSRSENQCKYYKGNHAIEGVIFQRNLLHRFKKKSALKIPEFWVFIRLSDRSLKRQPRIGHHFKMTLTFPNILKWK